MAPDSAPARPRRRWRRTSASRNGGTPVVLPTSATFWGPAADPDPKPSRSRRPAHVSAAVSLALLGLLALGWGAWTLDRPSLPPAGDALSALEAALATSRVGADIGGGADDIGGDDDADDVRSSVTPAMVATTLATAASPAPSAAERRWLRPEPIRWRSG